MSRLLACSLLSLLLLACDSDGQGSDSETGTGDQCGTPIPEGTLWSACDSARACQDGLHCLDEGGPGHDGDVQACVPECTEDSDCAAHTPPGGFGGDVRCSGYCLLRCVQQMDCPHGMTCANDPVGSDGYCVWFRAEP